jgi:hypothetical protein
MTNDVQTIQELAQQLAAAHGIHLTGYEFAALVALPHTLALHFWAAVRFYSYIGGFNGVKNFLKTGKLLVAA